MGSSFWQLIIKEYKYFCRNILALLLGVYVFFESYRTAVETIRNSVQSPYFPLEMEMLIRSLQFPLVIFLLLSGLLLFSYYRREGLSANRDIFLSKPVKTGQIILARYLGVTIALITVYLVGISVAAGGLRFLLSINFSFWDFINIFIAFPLLTLVIWSALICFLSVLSRDYRIALPMIFLLWFGGQLISMSFLIKYNRIKIASFWSDNYFFMSRGIWIIIALLLLAGSIYKYDHYRSRKLLLNKKSGLNSNGKKRKNEGVNLLPHRLAEVWYSIKIYSGWRIIVSVAIAILLAVVYSILAPANFQSFLYIGSGEILLSLLAILGSAGLNLVESEKKTASILYSMPQGSQTILKQKLITGFLYFIATITAYAFGGAVFISPAILGLIWIFIPTYAFFAVSSLLFTSISHSTLRGTGLVSIFWFIPLILERKYPYWFHPFYYFAEFDHFSYNFLLENRLILLGMSLLMVLFIGSSPLEDTIKKICSYKK